MPARRRILAVMIILQSESLTRPRIASALKPPKITEWMAPIRAQASMATASSGTMPQVDGDAIALLDAVGLENVGESTDLVVELAIGDVLDRVLFFTLPDDRRLVLDGRSHVPIETVVGHVEGTVGKPGVLDAAVLGVPDVLECLRGLLEPGQALRLLEPEFVGLLDRHAPHRLELFRARDVCPATNFFRRREGPFLGHQRFDGLFLGFHDCAHLPRLSMSGSKTVS